MKSRVIHGDCLEEMRKLPENSLDAIVSDPPYGISFMGKKWDEFTPKSFQEFSYQWGTEALRILKPGAYCLAFSGTRTYHRMVCGLEDAGFTIKDMIMWCYGSGFPKSLNISLAINKHLGGKVEKGKMKIAPNGGSYEKRCIIGHELTGDKYGGTQIKEDLLYEKLPTHPKAQQWDGWGTALKPSFEPIVVAQKPYIGTYAENILKYGVGGLNIGKCRIGYQGGVKKINIIPNSASHQGKGFGCNGNLEDLKKGRFPSNLLLTHHPECVLIGSKEVGSGKFILHKEQNRKPLSPTNATFTPTNSGFRPDKANGIGNYGVETVNAYSCHPECPIRILDEQSGDCKTGDITPYKQKSAWFNDGYHHQFNGFHKGDKGGASRFFYCGKAHKSERNAGLSDLPDKEVGRQGLMGEHNNPLQKNDIATLKPINIMRYLVRLVCPPNGIVLDPFAGSGTTGIACIIEGFNYILIEKRERFAKIIIPKRLKYWKDPNHWEILKDKNSLEKVNTLKNKKQNVSMENFL